MNSIFFGTFLAAMTTGIPIAIAMALGSLVYIWISGTIPPLTIVHRMVGGVDSFPLLAVPFFIFAGNLMNSAGITNRIFGFALKLVGWLKGGLGHVNVVGSVVFSGMSGTAVADAGGLGTIEIKAMKDHGYPVEFAVGVTAASATLGPIIPPSLPMVIYGVQANASIGKLFAGGFIPGAVMALLMMLMVGWYAHIRKYGADYPFSWRNMANGLGELVVVAITAVVLLKLWGERERTTKQIMAQVDRDLGAIPGYRAFTIAESGLLRRSGQPVQFVLTGVARRELQPMRRGEQQRGARCAAKLLQ